MAKSKHINTQLLLYFSVFTAICMFIVGGLSLWAHQFASTMVQRELAAQRIYFPEKGSPALDPVVYPDLQKYAGQLLDTPEEAKAYANGYIGRHLKKIANGKTYAEVSALSMKSPKDQELLQQKQTLFQGETLRTLLLTSGFGFGTLGRIAGILAYVSFTVGTICIAGALALRIRI